MKIRIAFVLTLAAAFLLTLASCEKDTFSPEGETSQLLTGDEGSSEAAVTLRGGGKGKKKRGEDEPTDPPAEEEVAYSATFQIAQPDVPDPLFRFSFSEDGSLVLLESDPNVGVWGSDYYGYWAEPFPYADGEVSYTIGLSNTTYQFTDISENQVDVTKILVVQPYLSGEPTTTVSHIGIFDKVN